MDFLQAQDVFTKGELSPTMYSRVTTTSYIRGLKRAKNVLPIPQGGARKRFGQTLSATLAQTNYLQIYPMVFEYRDECIYQLIFYNGAIDIYLEGQLVATVGSTGIDAEDVVLIDETILENTVRITVGFQAPRDLVRSASAANAITAITALDATFTLTNPITAGTILPVVFTTAGSLPTTSPQIKVGRVYFIRAITTTTAAIYATAPDARLDVNRFAISALGSASNMVALNTWAFSPVVFKNRPVYDFTGGYDAITFTPAATTGATTLASSGAIFTAAMVGGLFFGGGGIARITGFTNSTLVSILVIDDFSSTSGIIGALALLTEPAWSDTRGWPKVCGSYQNRSVFANTESLPNGLWLSAINDYNDFDDSTLDDDQAISWYPTSDVGNAIKFISPYRSLVVHTDSGVYSTPMQAEFAITPRTFSLTLQDNTPSATIQPVITDNQLIIPTGRDINSLLWEFGQSAYVPGLISAPSEHLITDPYSMAGFRDVGTAGGRYLFIINTDGTMAMWQTLLSEQIAGWTWAQTEQSYGNAYYRHVISSVLGRCWFIIEREIATAQSPIAISGFDATEDTLTATASNIGDTPIAVLFTTATSLPTTNPQIDTVTYYFAVGVDANDFKIYLTQADALADEAVIEITDAGVGASVVAYPLTTVLVMEELSYDVKTDCAIVEQGTALTQVTGLSLFNAQDVTVKADGLTYDSNPVLGGVEEITILGVQAEVSEVQVGHKITSIIQPLPISVAMGADPRTSNLAQAKHIRFANLMFVETVGGRVNNQNITLKNLNGTWFDAPLPEYGIMQVSLMGGWNQFKEPPFTIVHDEPYDFNLVGIFYRVEV